MKHTGIRLTAEEVKEVKALHRQASTTPVISFGGISDLSSHAWKHLHDRLDELAEAHGLPPTVGNYGLDGDELLTV